MIGGEVIEVRPTTVMVGESPCKLVDVIRIWCVERQSGSECVVYAKRYADCKVKPGDSVWWQSGKVMWTPADRSVIDVPLEKVGYTHRP